MIKLLQGGDVAQLLQSLQGGPLQLLAEPAEANYPKAIPVIYGPLPFGPVQILKQAIHQLEFGSLPREWQVHGEFCPTCSIALAEKNLCKAYGIYGLEFYPEGNKVIEIIRETFHAVPGSQLSRWNDKKYSLMILREALEMLSWDGVIMSHWIKPGNPFAEPIEYKVREYEPGRHQTDRI